MLSDLDEHDIREIIVFISSERLSAFHAIAGNERDAVILHQQVLSVSSALAPILAIIEITLRNTICERLRETFGISTWLQTPPAPFKWGEEEIGKIKEAERHAQRAHYAKLSNPEKRELDAKAYPNGNPKSAKHEARAKARQKAIDVTSGQLVAQLTLYFWKRLFSDDYQETLWKRSLQQIFPNKRLKRTDVSQHLEVLYQARNRVAHHEPIYDKRLVDVLVAVDFVSQNFRSKRPSDDTPLCKLLRRHRTALDAEVDELNAMLDRFRQTQIAQPNAPKNGSDDQGGEGSQALPHGPGHVKTP